MSPTLPHDDRKPYDDLRELVRGVPALDERFAIGVRSRIESFPGPAHPLGSLSGRLEWLAMSQTRDVPRVDRPLVAVFAAAHAAAGERASDIAKDRVVGVTRGAAPVRGIAANAGAAFKVYEFGIEVPADDMREGPSLTDRETAAAFAFGMEVVAEGADIIALGSIGTGSVAAAAAIARGLYGGSADYWAKGEGEVGRTRVDDVQRAAAANQDALTDPLSILSAFGGRDIAGLAGAIVAARYQSIPIILDGFVTCAAAAVLHAIHPDSIAHCLAGHVTGEFAQAAILDRMGLEPLHDFGVDVGDGTGAALALSTLKSACAGLETL